MRSLIHRLRSDDALMQAYQHGDVEAFECLYHRHKDGLFAFLYRSCGQQAAVEEVAQETWTAVIKTAPHYEARGCFKTWLYQIGRNRLLDFWRRKDNQHVQLEDHHEPATQAGDLPQENSSHRIMTAVAALPPDQRDTVLLREQGFSLAEIGQIMGAQQETVKSRLRYARNQLRSWLEYEPGATNE